MKSCAIFTNTEDKNIDKIYNTLKNEYYDICVFTESPTLSLQKDFAVLYSFYMEFYTGHIVFMNIDDYINNQQVTNNKLRYLVCNIEDIIERGLDKSSFKNTKFIKILPDSDGVEIL